MHGLLNRVTVIRSLGENIDQLELTVNDFDSYTMFGTYSEVAQYIGKEVEFSTRKDVVNNVVTDVINNVVAVSVVQKADTRVVGDTGYIDDIENMPSIIPDESKVIKVVDFDSKAIQMGEIQKSKTVFVHKVQSGSSKITTWKDFGCLDVNNNHFNLRAFARGEEIEEFCKEVVGHYVMVDIKRTQWGLQVMEGTDIVISEQEVMVPSEVLLARMSLNMALSKDDDLSAYCSKYSFIETLEKLIYFEPGYHLVEMFAELSILRAIRRISSVYDIRLLTRAVFATRGYLTQAECGMSNPVINYHKIITSPLRTDLELIKIIDVMNPAVDNPNKAIYWHVRETVTKIMKEVRNSGEAVENDRLNSVISSLGSIYGGMLQRGLDNV